MNPDIQRIADARICEDCENLVTTDMACPLCGAPTKEHPRRTEGDQYCVGCGRGPFPVEELHLVTWNEDPYTQTEDGDLSCLCPKCHAEDDEP